MTAFCSFFVIFLFDPMRVADSNCMAVEDTCREGT